MSEDPRKLFLESISLAKSIIHFDPSIILLFGGELNITVPEPASIREMFVEYCEKNNKKLANTIRLAEHYKDWYENKHYDNLLTFEEELTQLASLVVIILESPGAIGELGAFCVNEKINKKLVIVLSEEHSIQKSFITLGLMKQLDSEAQLPYEWDYNEIQNTVPSELPIMATDIEDVIKNQSTEDIDTTNVGHLSFVIHELIIQFKALTSHEIHEYLKILNVDVSSKEVKKYLYLLTLLELIKSRKKGNREFYIASCKHSRVAFSGYKSNFRIDESELYVSIMRYYRDTPKESIRLKIISQEYNQIEDDKK